MHLKIYAISFWVFLSTLTAFAQDHYTPGKVYTLGDTLTGYVNSQQTARYLKFKAEGGRITEYTPHQVLGFENNERVYLSKEVETNPYGEKIKEPLFMEQLVRGKVSLYYYKERDNEKHYWVEKGGEMVELQGGRKVVTVNQVKYQKEDKTYQIFLQQLFSDCNSKPDLHLCAFNKKALSQAVYEYNLCMGEKVVRNQYKKEKSIIVTGIRIGGNYFSMASSSYKFSPSVGVFVNLPLSKANRILAGQLEGNYNEYRADVGKDAIRYNVFDLTALIRFTYPKGLIRPFSGIGFTFGFGKEYAKYATSPKYKYLGKVDNPKLAFEAGLQVPLWRKYLYTSARYERFIFTPTGYYKPFNFSLGFGF